jgi:hypothetical protein
VKVAQGRRAAPGLHQHTDDAGDEPAGLEVNEPREGVGEVVGELDTFAAMFTESVATTTVNIEIAGVSKRPTSFTGSQIALAVDHHGGARDQAHRENTNIVVAAPPICPSTCSR